MSNTNTTDTYCAACGFYGTDCECAWHAANKIAEELRRPTAATPDRIAALIVERDRERARRRRLEERAALIARTKANNERARAERIADKRGVIGGES
jgi:hypothetical protein